MNNDLVRMNDTPELKSLIPDDKERERYLRCYTSGTLENLSALAHVAANTIFNDTVRHNQLDRESNLAFWSFYEAVVYFVNMQYRAGQELEESKP